MRVFVCVPAAAAISLVLTHAHSLSLSLSLYLHYWPTVIKTTPTATATSQNKPKKQKATGCTYSIIDWTIPAVDCTKAITITYTAPFALSSFGLKTVIAFPSKYSGSIASALPYPA